MSIAKEDIVYISEEEKNRIPGFYNTWIQSSSIGDTYPESIDDESSPSTIYFRKNIQPFTREEETEDGNTIVETGYTYDMMRIPRDEWDAKKETVTMRSEIDALNAAIMELTSMLLDNINVE